MTGLPARLHATAVLLGEAGLLIRGLSGSGKTSLALALVRDAVRSGCYARLVADDVVLVEALSGRLVARPHPTIAGKVERRGLGLLDVPHAPACVVRMIADIGGPGGMAMARLPEPSALLTSIAGIDLPCVSVSPAASVVERMGVILDALTLFRAGS